MELVLLPGVNNMASTFSVLRASLDDGVLAQALDLPARDRIEDVAKDVLSRAPEKFVALGHSFGGMVAMALAEIAPERLAGLILVNTCDWADTPALKDMRTDKAARALAGEYEDFANAATARAYHPDNAGRAELLVERANAVKAYGAERFAAKMQ